MLSLIQSSTVIITGNTGGKEDLSKDQLNELRVLDALSAVAVRQHEVVAVMAKSYNGFNGSNIEVVASVGNVVPDVNTPHTATTQSLVDSDRRRNPLRWFITPNPRLPDRKAKTDSLRTKSPIMTLADPDASIPDELSNLKARPHELLDAFLRTVWWVFWCYPTNQTLMPTMRTGIINGRRLTPTYGC